MKQHNTETGREQISSGFTYSKNNYLNTTCKDYVYLTVLWNLSMANIRAETVYYDEM